MMQSLCVTVRNLVFTLLGLTENSISPKLFQKLFCTVFTDVLKAKRGYHNFWFGGEEAQTTMQVKQIGSPSTFVHA